MPRTATPATRRLSTLRRFPDFPLYPGDSGLWVTAQKFQAFSMLSMGLLIGIRLRNQRVCIGGKFVPITKSANKTGCCVLSIWTLRHLQSIERTPMSHHQHRFTNTTAPKPSVSAESEIRRGERLIDFEEIARLTSSPGILRPLGDANGYREIWAYAHPLFLCYTTRIGLDSLFDGVRRFDGLLPETFVNLGKIDDSRWETIAVGARLRKWDETESRGYVFFLQGTPLIPRGMKRRNLPHELDALGCNSTVSVEEAIVQSEKASPLGLAVRPNPSSGEIVIQWSVGSHGHATSQLRMFLTKGTLSRLLSAQLPRQHSSCTWLQSLSSTRLEVFLSNCKSRYTNG